jgi:hypothetical protein
MLFPSSGLKSKSSNKPAYFILGSLFNPEDGGGMFLPNVTLVSLDYMALYPRR